MRSFPHKRINPCCILIAAAVCLASLAHLPVVQSQNERIDNERLYRDYPKLTSRLGRNKASVDFVIVLDYSGSMRTIWGAIRNGLRDFIGAVPEGDQLSIVSFGDPSSSAGCFHPDRRRQFTGAQLRQNIETLCEPTGGYTDIGQGVSDTLDSLETVGGSEWKVVFFFTDFEHNAPSTSPYYNQTDPNHEVWIELKKRRDNTLHKKNLVVYGFKTQTRAAGQERHDNFNLVQKVFPEIIPIDMKTESLGYWFDQIRAEVLRDRLRVQVQGKIGNPKIEQADRLSPLKVKAVQQGDEVIAQITNPGDDIIDTEGLEQLKVELGKEAQSFLEPIDSTDKPFTFSSENGASVVNVPIARVRRGWFDWGDKEKPINLSFKLSGKRLIGPPDELQTLNPPGLQLTDTKRPFINFVLPEPDTPFPLKIRGEVPLSEKLLGVFALILAAGWGVNSWKDRQWREREEYLKGKIELIHHERDFNLVKKTIDLDNQKQLKNYSIGKVAPHTESPTSQAQSLKDVAWTVHFEARKDESEDRRGTYLTIKGTKANVEISPPAGRKEKRQLGGDSEPLRITGRVTISIGDSKITHTNFN